MLTTDNKSLIKKLKSVLRKITFCLFFLGTTTSFYAQTTTLAEWDFNTLSTSATVFNANNAGKQLISSQSIDYTAGPLGGSDQAASAEGWNGGGGSDFWQIEVNTTGFESIKISSWQKGSNSGPANFKVQYRVGTTGVFTDVTGAVVNMTNTNWAAYGKLTDVEIPSAVNEQPVVQIRWLMVNNDAIGGGNTQSGGNSRIDDIIVTGIPACVLPATPTGTIETVGTAPFCGNSISFTRNGGSAAPAGIVFYWQTSASGTNTSFPLTTNPTFTITGTGLRNAYLRARRTTGGCWSTNSISASGTVFALPIMTAQPQNTAVTLNSNASFTATSTGTVTSRQWQVSTDNGGNWQNLSNDTTYSGVTSATLTVSNVTTPLHLNQYRMVSFNNACFTESNAAILSITGTPTINMQPVLTYDYCNTAKIEMAAANAIGTQTDLTYNWFVYTPGSTDWTPIINDGHYSGATTSTLYINSLIGLNRSQYYVQVRYKNQTCYTATKSVAVIETAVPNRWNGTNWTNGVPNNTTVVVLDANYNTNIGSLTACALDLNGNTITINEDQFVQIENTIGGLGTININNNGSLVQKQDNAVNGKQWTMNMERITQKMYRFDFTYWSSPVATTTLHDLSPDTLFDKYYWWNAGTYPGTLGWRTSLNGTEAMIAGKGYAVRAPQTGPFGVNPAVPESYHNFTANFIGQPNNGTISYPVAGGTDVYNLIGNPYPSAIDADQFIADNLASGAIKGTLYFWTHNSPVEDSSYTASDYATYTLAGGVGTDEASSDTNPDDNTPKGQIAAGQSFFVEGNDPTGTVVFNNAMRLNLLNKQFFRPGPTEPVENWEMTGKHRIWLNIKNDNTGFNQILVGYIQNATNGNDMGYDGKSFSGNKVTLYSINENENLTIQARGLPFNNQDQVPLGYTTIQSGMLTISIDHLDGIFENQAIYLEDLLLGVTHDLKASNYTFSSAAGTFNNRFVLKYTNNTLGNDDHQSMNHNLLIYKKDTTISIISEAEAIEEVTVYDLLGRIIFERKKLATTTFSTSELTATDQVIIVKATLANGTIVSKKVVF